MHVHCPALLLPPPHVVSRGLREVEVPGSDHKEPGDVEATPVVGGGLSGQKLPQAMLT